MPRLTDGKGMHIARIAKARRAFICRHLPLRSAKVLEFGALDNPTFVKSEGDVYFADFFTQEESRDRHGGAKTSGHTVELIVPVDFVLRDRTIESIGVEEYDLVIANHVLEHLPNPIRWLREVRRICGRDAYLHLSLPDKRFTFDRHKPETDAVDWLRAFDEDVERPTKYQILRHLYYHTDLDAPRAWRGEVPTDHLHRIVMKDAIERAAALASDYTDVHCSVFTASRFRAILQDLSSTDLVPWSEHAFADVAEGDNEFRIILRAT